MKIWDSIFLRSWERGDSLPILLYHAVDEEAIELSIKPDHFRLHMEWIKSECNPISLTDLEDVLNGKKRILRPAFVTFDDGLSSVYENAFPILAKFNIPFSIFLATGAVGKTFCINGREKGMLGYEELQEMLRSGLMIPGSHTHSHSEMVKQSSENIEFEIKDSSRIISELTGKPPFAFAFPKGKADLDSKKVIQKHFRLAFGGEGLCHTGKTPSSWIPRINIRRRDGIARLRASLYPLFWKARSVYSWIR